jgi:hypothetical protein
MLLGFAANIIVLNGERHKNALLRTRDGRLHSLTPLTAELPMTRFFDGALIVGSPSAPAPTLVSGEPIAPADASKLEAGDAVVIRQAYPYDVLADRATPQTRIIVVEDFRA